MGADRRRHRLTRISDRLDRLATYGFSRSRRTGELADRAATLAALRELVPERRLLHWKLRSTACELFQRLVLRARTDPTTVPAAARLLFVSLTTAVISGMAMNPANALVDRQDSLRSDVFLGAQMAAGMVVIWLVVVLLRNPDHLPIRQMALPHAVLAVVMASQAVTNSPVHASDHLYTISCTVYAVGTPVLALAGWGFIPSWTARWAFRMDAAATVLTGLNVFDLVSKTYGAVSVVGAVQVLGTCVGVTAALMLARLPFHSELPPSASPLAPGDQRRAAGSDPAGLPGFTHLDRSDGPVVKWTRQGGGSRGSRSKSGTVPQP